MTTLAAQVAHPVGRASAYRVGNDGIARVLPWSGGITLNHRIGDRCVGLAGDHIEPGVSLHNNSREVTGGPNGPNLALMTYACVGNVARVVSGPAAGSRGIVTGKHGGVEHVIVDFPARVMRQMRIGDQIQIWSIGLGLRLLDHRDVTVLNCSPALLQRWGLRSEQGRLHVPVSHLVPAAIMGSGLGRPDAARGDYDIQLFDPVVRRRFRLDTLRFGDLVAIVHADTQFGRAYRRGAVTIGVVVHSDSTISGHGPGVVTLLTTREGTIRPRIDPNANLARVFGIRPAAAPRRYEPLAGGAPSRRSANPTARAIPPIRPPTRPLGRT